MSNYEKHKPLVCPLCGEVRRTRGGMYWHISIDHEKQHEEAFELAGEASEVEVYPK
ncbi:MAG: hypothetical protein WCP12_16120 [bacterium]